VGQSACMIRMVRAANTRRSGCFIGIAGWIVATCGGCYTQGPSPSRRPGSWQAGTTSAPTEQAFDARLVDPHFEQAFADYWRDLRTLGWDATDNEIRRSLRLLAIAAERVPHTGSVDLAGAAARVRGGRTRGAAFAAASDDAIEKPLQELARAFIEVARGPYREGVGVLAAAYGFDQAVNAMSAARARGGDRRASFAALGRGQDLLFAIRGAIGRGEVGLLGTAPPPADFDP